jgi:hypothetical protein
MNEYLSIEEELIYYKNKVNELNIEINLLKDHLKKYTSPERRKKFYQEHKEELLHKNKEYQEKITPEKRAEYNKKAYLKRKEKIKNKK